MRPSCLETSEASSGSSSPQKISDVVFPVRISNENHESTEAPSLEEALSIPLVERERERYILSSSAQCGGKIAQALTPNKCAAENTAKFQRIVEFTERAKVAGRRIQAGHDRAAGHVRERPVVAEIVGVVGEPVLRGDVDLPELFVEHKQSVHVPKTPVDLRKSRRYC